MLYWIYIAIVILITFIVFVEMFSEKDWKKQISLAMLLIPFLLRIFQIK